MIYLGALEMGSKFKLFVTSFLVISTLIGISATSCSILTTTSTSTLTYIALSTISAPNLAVGSVLQFTATGTYSDGSTVDITHDVRWSSVETAIAIDSLGIATGVAAGTASIKATLDGITSPEVILTVTPAINRSTGKYNNYYLGLAEAPNGGLIGGDGCYDDEGNFVVLINNSTATNPTYSQVINFLKNDFTDEYPYTTDIIPLSSYLLPAESHVDLAHIKNIIDGNEQPSNPRICCDFAERLHNNAEKAGIRCAYVAIDLSTGGHAIDAFQTTDRGLIYFDDTGPDQEPHPIRAVKTVDFQVGSKFIPVSLFPERGWDSTYDSIGMVIDMKIEWDGTWNN